MDQENTFEEWTITIGTPDDGYYQINFVDPTVKPTALW
jgi:hypothetical protein